MIVHEPCKIKKMSLSRLWRNYLEAMDAAIMAARAGEDESSVFYVAVVRVTLDQYFSQIERHVR